MIHPDNFLPVSINLVARDIFAAAELYKSIFGWVIFDLSVKHGEMGIPIGESLLEINPSNSPNTKFYLGVHIDLLEGDCPADPGTITLDAKTYPGFTEHPLWRKCFREEFYSSKHKYASFLDPDKNRIWVTSYPCSNLD
jgi:hypothetical protein